MSILNLKLDPTCFFHFNLVPSTLVPPLQFGSFNLGSLRNPVNVVTEIFCLLNVNR